MRLMKAAALALLLAQPALAQELPKFPKAAPPEPLPEATCDTARPSSGEWLRGRWVAPQATRMEFTPQGNGWAWTFERKGSVNTRLGWDESAGFGGKVDQVTACTVQLSGGDGAFRFEGVLTEDGKLYSFAANPKGDTVRFVFRRER